MDYVLILEVTEEELAEFPDEIETELDIPNTEEIELPNELGSELKTQDSPEGTVVPNNQQNTLQTTQTHSKDSSEEKTIYEANPNIPSNPRRGATYSNQKKDLYVTRRPYRHVIRR